MSELTEQDLADWEGIVAAGISHEDGSQNLRFIDLAFEAIPQLIAEHRRLQAQVIGLRKALEIPDGYIFVRRSMLTAYVVTIEIAKAVVRVLDEGIAPGVRTKWSPLKASLNVVDEELEAMNKEKTSS